MKTGNKINEQQCRDNEKKIRKDFVWSLSSTAIHETNATEFSEKNAEMNLLQSITAFAS